MNQQVSVRTKQEDMYGSVQQSQPMDFGTRALADDVIVDVDDVEEFFGGVHDIVRC